MFAKRLAFEICRHLVTTAGLLAAVAAPALAGGGGGGVTFTDIAAGGANGLAYQRAPSATVAIYDAFAQLPVLTQADWVMMPEKPHGAPGVAIFDYDGDGDQDLYVTNGPGAANSLFHNRLAETGSATFVDVGTAAGVAALDQDSSGVCAGDLDNDGDPDLLVLSNFGTHRLFRNRGDGTFDDVTAGAGLGGEGKSSIGCSLGDVDGDGLLDVAVGNNSVDMSHSLAIVVPFDFAQHDQLFRNLGGLVFEDVSTASGIEDTTGFFPPLFDGSPTVTWALALVDIDQDGDVDLVKADDQGGVPFARDGGVDRGLIHIMRNDGSGLFTDVTGSDTPASPGAWMGLAFGDLDSDGLLDLFASNLGDYAQTTVTPLDPTYLDIAVYFLGDLSSRWYLGAPGGALIDPGLGPLVATPFGWGTSIFDYDNDADADIVMHGGLVFGPVIQGSPAALLRNDGDAVFERDAAAFAGSTDHEARTVQGVAVGDLDGNGFADIVSVSNADVPAAAQVLYNQNWGSAFDGGRYLQAYTPTGDLSGDAVFSGVPLSPGTLSVELSSGGNGNRSFAVRTLGTAGLVTGGAVNRDGVGAVVSVRTARGKRTARPVVAGSSYASQDSLELLFGLGRARFARVEVLWPGGVRNRLYGVRRGERVRFPEIPCSYDVGYGGAYSSFGAYAVCVGRALGELEAQGIVTRREKKRFFTSALIAFFDG